MCRPLECRGEAPASSSPFIGEGGRGMGKQRLRIYCIELYQVDFKVKINVILLRCVIHTLITSNHHVQSLTTGLIANNAPIRPMQALMPPCTRHILSLYEERMQRRSGTTLSIGFSLHPFLNDRFAEQTNFFIIIIYSLQRTDCLSVCIALRCVLCSYS